MGIVNFGPPEELIRRLKETYRITTFIETGTYHGCTAYWASSVFDHVITVEASESFYEKVAEKYRHIKNIEFIYGDSRERLGDVVARLDGPAIFWLDAHWSGGETYGQTTQCPLIGEIEAINRSEHKHFIFIDDARLFMSPPPSPHSIEQWPDICAVISALNSSDNIKYITIFEDVITAVPSFARHLVDHYCRDKNAGTQKERGGEPVETRPSDSCRLGAKTKQQSLTNSELELIKKFISSGDVVFDIGADVGTWTKEVFNKRSNIQVHLFEPVPKSYQKLLQNLAEPIKTGQVTANNCAVSEKEGDQAFYYYRDKPSWSTFHQRLEVEKQFNLESPESLPVSTVTLDSYCEKMNVRRIHFLKIDTEGSEFEVIKGAKELLRKGRIDYLQFEYGGTFLDAGITLQEVFEYLKLMRYEIFKMSPDGLKHIESFSPTYEDYEYSNFLAVNERFKLKVLGQPPTMLNLQDLCNRYNIVPRGIIHIGAHEGKEAERYQAMGVQKVLFIEANPAVYKRLVADISTLPNVDAVNCAVSNYDGTTTLHVTSMDQSSSVLPLKRHLEIYPDIKEVNQITVDCKTLDSLLKELGMSTSDFNIINIDIQGAELMAFQGATDTLKYIDAINTEVNYEELYEGCALIDQLDGFLEDYGFERKATTTPYHRSWGDGFYVKTQTNSDKPVITMSTLGKNGRFANQVFQYAFLKIYAKQHNLEVRTPPWIGQGLFGHKDPPILRKLTLVKETTNELAEAVVPNTKETFENVDFWGYFQYNTSYYAPARRAKPS